jgi:adenylosuccinate lyase
MQGFINDPALKLPAEEKARLLAMTPADYTGLAATLAQRIG